MYPPPASERHIHEKSTKTKTSSSPPSSEASVTATVS